MPLDPNPHRLPHCLTRRRPIACRPLALAVCLLVMAGCDAPLTGFAPNLVYTLRLEHETGNELDRAVPDVQAALERLFGTPDAPRVPDALSGMLDAQRLAQAAGPVASDREGIQSGLYREHCAVCHGVAGDGAGPAVGLQNPYPRDFRMGVFKYKSTPRGEKPTRQDLLDILRHGVPGTAMPSFVLLERQEIEALTDYVIYLSARGELERRLLAEAAREIDYADPGLPAAQRLLAPELEQTDPPAFAAQLAFIEEEMAEIAQRWQRAEHRIQPVPPVPDWVVAPQKGPLDSLQLTSEMRSSIERGKQLFHGQVANCVGCHGPAGVGGVAIQDYDEWTKDWTTRIGITPGDREATEPFREVGALRPRMAEPRNLQLGVFRGGGTPETLFRRIVNGIDGTPMPGVILLEQPGGTGLTADQVWDLVNYVLALGRQRQPEVL